MTIAAGATAVRPLLPDETDAELTRLYVVDRKDEASGRRLLKLLNASRAVEFVQGHQIGKSQIDGTKH